VKSREDNIINWRHREPLLDWCEKDSLAAGRALGQLWDEAQQRHQRIATFSETLKHIGLPQAGARLCVTSVLLMANDAVNNPPVRAKVLTRMLSSLELPKVGSDTSVPQRYQIFISLLDALIEYSQASDRPFRHRLEAQGAVWCATGGWKPVGSELDQRLSNDAEREERIERDLADSAPDLSKLEETERKTIVGARRGQGRYRNELLGLWSGCAVTGCTEENILRASHLKPWRDSTNEERLDRFNGLLLTPNLDLLLDRCLISFTDEGTMLISRSISPSDRDALGLRERPCLRFVQVQHRRYLAFHRNLFDERERVVADARRRQKIAPDE
jgi:hypothetical protein